MGEAAAPKPCRSRSSSGPTSSRLDLQMPGTSGLDAIRVRTMSAPWIAVVVLTMFDNECRVLFTAMRAGARGSPGERSERGADLLSSPSPRATWCSGSGVRGRAWRDFSAATLSARAA